MGRDKKLENTALVFLIRGLLHNWKISLCYFVSAGPVNSSSLAKIIPLVIIKLKKLSFNPMVLVCDQGSNNRSALGLLGATSENPMISINDYNVFNCFDAPHLLKSVRINFMNKKIQFVVTHKHVAWTDITTTYKIDLMSNTTRAMVKITPNHIEPTNFQKMRVKYAAQIFSHTVAAAVKTAASTQ